MGKEKPKIVLFDPQGDIASKFDFYIKIVVGVLVIAMLNMLLMSGTVIIDSLHFNSAVYKEYSDKINTLESIQKSNAVLSEDNKRNQQIIIEQQNKIHALLKKITD